MDGKEKQRKEKQQLRLLLMCCEIDGSHIRLLLGNKFPSFWEVSGGGKQEEIE